MNDVMPLIQLDNVGKVYVADEIETHALDGVHLKVKEGEFVSIAGPSGCGKSTLLAIIGLLEDLSGGSLLLDGRDVASWKIQQRTKIRNEWIGFIFQSFNLIGEMTVLENVELPLRYRGVKATERRELAMDALKKVEMSNRRNHLPSQLSGGQQQRVAVARALAGNPRILLADEPTGNLDSRNGQIVMELLQQLHAEGVTICMVTHDERYAGLADRVVHLFDGKIISETAK